MHKQISKEVEESTKSCLRRDFEELIAKTKAEIISDGMTSMYKHKFGTNIFTSNITFRSARIENLMLDKRLELDKQKKVEGSLLIYDNLILQHAKMKGILEEKYDLLMNAIIYDKFITKFLKSMLWYRS